MSAATAAHTLDSLSEPGPKSIHITGVPTAVFETLSARAAALGMPLDVYLRHHITEPAKPTMAELLESAADRDWGVDRDLIVRAVRESREEAETG